MCVRAVHVGARTTRRALTWGRCRRAPPPPAPSGRAWSQEGLFQAVEITSRQDNEILLEVPVDYLAKAIKSILADPTSELLLVRLDGLPGLRFTATVTGRGASRPACRPPLDAGGKQVGLRYDRHGGVGGGAQSRPGDLPRIVQDVPVQVRNRPEDLDAVRRLALPTPDVGALAHSCTRASARARAHGRG